jgi:hypothetical protein
MVRDGSDAYTVVLSNESMTIPCSADGSFPTGTFDPPYKYYTNLTVYKGKTKLEKNVAYGYGLGETTDRTI